MYSLIKSHTSTTFFGCITYIYLYVHHYTNKYILCNVRYLNIMYLNNKNPVIMKLKIYFRNELLYVSFNTLYVPTFYLL